MNKLLITIIIIALFSLLACDKKEDIGPVSTKYIITYNNSGDVVSILKYLENDLILTEKFTYTDTSVIQEKINERHNTTEYFYHRLSQYGAIFSCNYINGSVADTLRKYTYDNNGFPKIIDIIGSKFNIYNDGSNITGASFMTMTQNYTTKGFENKYNIPYDFSEEPFPYYYGFYGNCFNNLLDEASYGIGGTHEGSRVKYEYEFTGNHIVSKVFKYRNGSENINEITEYEYEYE